MESKIAKAICLKYQPVCLIWSDEKPETAMQFKEGTWGCIMWLLASAAKGKTAVADRATFGCPGGGVGLGFGNMYNIFPGGEKMFCHFLSTGTNDWDEGKQVLEQIKPFLRSEILDGFLNGERYQKSPEQVKKFLKCLPMTDVPAKYVVFKPLSAVDLQKEQPVEIIFFADPDQISCLVVLANYDRDHYENVITPYAAGCQNIGIFPYKEAEKENPRAVLGLTDLSARLFIRKQLEDNLFTFTVPLRMFKEMEANVEDSFLQQHTWQTIVHEKYEHSSSNKDS